MYEDIYGQKFTYDERDENYWADHAAEESEGE